MVLVFTALLDDEPEALLGILSTWPIARLLDFRLLNFINVCVEVPYLLAITDKDSPRDTLCWLTLPVDDVALDKIIPSGGLAFKYLTTALVTARANLSWCERWKSSFSSVGFEIKPVSTKTDGICGERNTAKLVLIGLLL